MHISPEILKTCQARGLNRAEIEALCPAELREQQKGQSDGVLALLRKTRTMSDVAREINGTQQRKETTK